MKAGDARKALIGAALLVGALILLVAVFKPGHSGELPLP